MEVFSGARGVGKTRELIKYAFDNGYIIVCENPIDMLERIYSMGLSNIDVISYKEYIEFLLNRYSSPDNFVIDEIETFLSLLSEDIKIRGFTVVV